MKKGEKLYRLINGMSGSEKRHFSLYAKAFQKKKEDNDYINLFHLIEKHKIQDDFALQQLPEVSQFKSLSNLKIYLYKKILDSLILNSNQNVDDLYKELLRARQLLKKGLYTDAIQVFQTLQKKNQKLHTSLTEYDNLFHQFALRRFNVKSINAEKNEEIQILLEMQDFLDIQKIQNQFLILEIKVNSAIFKMNNLKDREKVEDLLSDPLLNDPRFLKNDYCYNLYFSIRSILYSFLGKTALYVECAKQRFDYNLQLSKSSVVIPQIEAWRTLLFALTKANDENQFMKYLDFFETKEIPTSLQNLYTFFKYKTLLIFCSKNKHTVLYNERDVEDKTEKILISKKQAPLNNKTLIYFKALYYFRLKDFEKSLMVYDYLIVGYKFNVESKTELSLAILYFLILLEKEDFQYAFNQISNFQRRVKEQRPEEKYLIMFLKQLQSYCKYSDKDNWDKSKILTSLKKMKKILYDSPSLEYGNLYRMLYVSEWAEEKQQYYLAK